MTVVIVIHLMIVLAMIGVVLLQKSEGGGLGIGSTGGFMTNRGSANVLTRATAYLAGAFFATSLALSVIAGMGRAPTSIINPGGTTTNTPGTPTAPGGGLLDQLREREGAPPAPAPAPTPPAP
jgi:preprotein translocase subunit SecG